MMIVALSLLVEQSSSLSAALQAAWLARCAVAERNDLEADVGRKTKLNFLFSHGPARTKSKHLTKRRDQTQSTITTLKSGIKELQFPSAKPRSSREKRIQQKRRQGNTIQQKQTTSVKIQQETTPMASKRIQSWNLPHLPCQTFSACARIQIL
jgi:hypothetical protein